jgi:hypothetical protein
LAARVLKKKRKNVFIKLNQDFGWAFFVIIERLPSESLASELEMLNYEFKIYVEEKALL